MPYSACFDLFPYNPCPSKQNHTPELLLDAVVAAHFIGIDEVIEADLCSISACPSHFYPFRDRN